MLLVTFQRQQTLPALRPRMFCDFFRTQSTKNVLEGLHMGQKDTDASDAESLPRSYEGKSVDVSISQSRGSLDVDSQSDEVCHRFWIATV